LTNACQMTGAAGGWKAGQDAGENATTCAEAMPTVNKFL